MAMDMNLLEVFSVLVWIGGLVALAALCYLLIMLGLIVRSFKLISDRLELVSDLSGWLKLIRKFPGKFKD